MKAGALSTPGAIRRPFLYSAAVLALPFLAALWLSSNLTWPCPLKLISGLPCAACGGIRSLAALAHLDVLGALRLNPLVALLAFSLPILFLTRRTFVVPPALVWSAIGANWAYLLLFLPK